MAKKSKGVGKKKSSPRVFFVMNPWKDVTPTDDWQGICNAIGAWFEAMLKVDYPDTRPTVWFQKTHANVLVELPSEVKDPTQYLGTHRYSEFLKDRPYDDRLAYVYPYNSSRGTPEDNSWKEEFPNYDKVPPRIVALFTQPYPPSSPAPAPPFEIEWAKPISLEIAARLAARHQAPPPCFLEPPAFDSLQSNIFSPVPGPSSLSQAVGSPVREEQRDRNPIASVREDGKGKSRDITASTSQANEEMVTTNHFAPYTPPQLRRSISPARTQASEHIMQVKKMDPYEEAEAAQELLRSISPVKTEIDTATDHLLNSILSIKQEDSATPASEEEEEYKPSAELLELLGTLPPEVVGMAGPSPEEEDVKPTIKPEPMEAEMPADPEYRPSEELLSLLAMLPQEMSGAAQGGVPVKDEPREDMKLEPQTIRIKEEVVDPRPNLSWNTRSSLHSVETDTRPEFSRDPRIRARALAAANGNSVLQKRGDNGDVREIPETSPKRIKKEPVD